MKSLVVTGSNKGIGRGIIETLCKQLSQHEWDIYVTARNTELGMKTVSELESQGLHVKFHQLDIDCEKSRKELKEYLQNKYGGLDILINNAGIAYKGSSTAPFSEQAEVTLKTNFYSTLKMCEEFIPILKKDARLVNVSSMMGHVYLRKLSEELYKRFLAPMTMDELNGYMDQFVSSAKDNSFEMLGWPKSAYGVSKIGVTKMTYILAEQWKGDPRNILINSCCPGYVGTDLNEHSGPLTVYEGADTPVYLATLPIGTKSPYGEFVLTRNVNEWK